MRFWDAVATVVLWLSALVLLFILAWFITSVLRQGLPGLSWQFITGKPHPVSAGGGIGPPLFNTFYVTLLSLILALPFGMGAGIYLALYARPGRRVDALRLGVQALASVPSIVLGLFGMVVFSQAMGFGFSILSGSLALAILNLPLIVNVTEQSLRDLPATYRDASLALGATPHQTLVRVLLPAALPALVNGLTLAAGRAAGETAVLVYTAGVSTSGHLFDLNPFAPGGTLAVYLWGIKANPIVPDWQQIANRSAAVLLLVVLAINGLLLGPVRLWYRRFSGRGPH